MSVGAFFWWLGGFYAILLALAVTNQAWLAYLWIAWVAGMILLLTIHPGKPRL